MPGEIEGTLGPLLEMVTDHVIKIGVGGLLEGDKKEKKEAEVKEFRGESRETYQSFIQSLSYYYIL